MASFGPYAWAFFEFFWVCAFEDVEVMHEFGRFPLYFSCFLDAFY